MDTIAYIDGYNFYYGRLRNTPYKWINVFKLVEIICSIQEPSTKLVKVKYFTAPSKARFARNGQNAPQSQTRYHNALKQICGESLDIIKGYHTVEKATPPVYQKPVDRNKTVAVWRFEEKQTDVNIAVHMYRDAIQAKYKQQVIMSNDSDLECALKYIKEDVGDLKLGLIIPRKKESTDYKLRPITEYLNQYSDWTRTHILDEECNHSLMPDMVPTMKKPIYKPDYW